MNTPNPTTKCAECGGYAYDAVVAEDVKVRHDGKWYTLPVPNLLVSKCEKCGAIYRDNRADDQIQDALRSRLRAVCNNLITHSTSEAAEAARKDTHEP